MDLKGLKAPPLVDGKFCIHTYREWMTVNKYWPWQMTFDQYKQWLDDHSKPKSDNLFVRLDQDQIRLSNLKHWFFSVQQAFNSGLQVSLVVLEDYNTRSES